MPRRSRAWYVAFYKRKQSRFKRQSSPGLDLRNYIDMCTVGSIVAVLTPERIVLMHVEWIR